MTIGAGVGASRSDLTSPDTGPAAPGDARAARLTPDQVSAYRRDGILFPLEVTTAAEAGGWLAQLEACERAHGGRLSGRIGQKPHLLYPWMDRLVRHPVILDAVADLLGPDLFCWGSQFFAKDPRDPSYVSWHQDATYWGLSSPDVVTAWVALTPSVPANGCMRVIPGTHRQQVPHEDTFAETNLLSRGQEIDVDVTGQRIVDVELSRGQMSLHHVLLAHNSEPNRADHDRVGFAIRYIGGHVRQTKAARDTATLVRGRNAADTFELEQAPRGELEREDLAYHAAVVAGVPHLPKAAM